MRKGNSVVNKIKQNGVKYTIHALQELNISPNHFHLPDRTSWVPFLLAQRRISLAPGNRTTVNVKPCIVMFLYIHSLSFILDPSCILNPPFTKLIACLDKNSRHYSLYHLITEAPITDKLHKIKNARKGVM